MTLKKYFCITFKYQHASVSTHTKTTSSNKNKQYYAIWCMIFTNDRHAGTEKFSAENHEN